ncbi:oxidoreductase [Embleya scabrispora]|uniref:Oxidoreductase n=1 Tax=Embleya scabrispora TaxID=159449 RepID=A0A1T3NZS4_9ACTN|nr:glucose 1-dehydrogenase [Embleya scabrispora]OPC82140.1 oxidoreductase [Embleya scabrispora]
MSGDTNEVRDANAMFDLSGRVAIVTGGSRGIGRAIAHAYAAAGASVVIASRKADACEAVAKEITDAGGRALAVATHCGELEQLAVLVDTTVAHFGGIDIVVNNAANELAQPLGAITPQAWDKSFSVNLRGPVFLVQYALPHLIASGRGSVVNVVSAAVFTRAEGKGLYAAGKAGLVAFTRTMAGELAEHGIRVNAMAPGAVETDMVRKTGPETMARMRGAAPLNRIAAPEEMTGLALLLASDAGSFMTGQIVSIDGGLTVH